MRRGAPGPKIQGAAVHEAAVHDHCDGRRREPEGHDERHELATAHVHARLAQHARRPAREDVRVPLERSDGPGHAVIPLVVALELRAVEEKLAWRDVPVTLAQPAD
eukprot:9199300-Pyramimonas_sp.AAC.1